jgi:hypothetical protein
MRLVDARNHRQGDGDQGSRLTVLSRRCVAEAAPTSLLSAMSAAERGADQHGKGAAYLIKPLFCTPPARCPGSRQQCREDAPVLRRGIAEGATDLT